jgi:DNA-binding NarL/FixJ family response regulator
VITVLLVDDESLVRAGLRAILEAQPDIAVVGEAADGAAVVPLVRKLRPDVVAMDVRMPLMDGIEATRAVLRAVDQPPKILVITTFENDEYVYQALRAGANGFCSNDLDRPILSTPSAWCSRVNPCSFPPRSARWPPNTETAQPEMRWTEPRSPSGKRPFFD